MSSAIGPFTAGIVVGILAALVSAGAAIAIVLRLYRKRPYRQPGAHQPGLVWFPKYRLALPELPPWQEVEARLTAFGFGRDQDEESRDALRFSRGSPWLDFSIRLAKMEVTVRGRPGGPGELLVEAGGPVLFDTGDTWELTRQLGESLQPDPPRAGAERLCS
ncbi:hypothetical protein [Halorhodospira neutriphila]|uniref:Uncharacterized protein n=1 Tax=Halorhodospira neutriphila TaxID=168379 RepID=A0ABS1E297_9GAMM|nr:hypothetical protein [Halorhodospira neutriphila]MBK1725603.1 hypothetical protein [Halorhodospira neutriphila]